MEPSLLTRSIQKRLDKVKLAGRILFLTEDPELIRRQLAGEDLPWDTRNPEKNPKLRDDISTDEITPAHICFSTMCGWGDPIGRLWRLAGGQGVHVERKSAGWVRWRAGRVERRRSSRHWA